MYLQTTTKILNLNKILMNTMRTGSTGLKKTVSVATKTGGNVIFNHQGQGVAETPIRQPLKLIKRVFQLTFHIRYVNDAAGVSKPGVPSKYTGESLYYSLASRGGKFRHFWHVIDPLFTSHPQQKWPFDHCRTFLFRDDSRFDALQNVGHSVLLQHVRLLFVFSGNVMEVASGLVPCR